MSGVDFLRFKGCKGVGVVRKAARHNRRAIQAELGASTTIDPSRSHLNFTLVGPPTADDVPALAEKLMREAGVTALRKDAVRVVEIVLSLPVDSPADPRRYFTDCVAWVADRFGGVDNILSADVHLDEAAPHCHVLVLPLMDGRMQGSRMIGNRPRLMEHRQTFHEAVGRRYGLAKAPPRLQGAARTDAAQGVIQSLKQGQDGALTSKLWPLIRAAIEAEPGRYLQALGLQAPERPRPLKTMAAIFTSPGKGPRREPKPIDVARPLRGQSLCSVGLAAPTVEPQRPQAPPRPPTPAGEPIDVGPAPMADTHTDDPPLDDFTREREDNQRAEDFDPLTGEFFRVTRRRVRSEGWALCGDAHHPWAGPPPDDHQSGQPAE